MNVLVTPGSLSGAVAAVASKSMAHRLLVLRALSGVACPFVCDTTSEDIEATRRCLDALGLLGGTHTAIRAREGATLDCGESGSTLRFLLPVVCALGTGARFVRRGRLAARPLAPLDEVLRAHGATIREQGADIVVSGRMSAGRFELPGDVSSQYISGLLMAATVLDAPAEVLVGRPVQSRPYIELTIHALAQFGQAVEVSDATCHGRDCERFALSPRCLVAPERCVVEGDWSNAAFWLAAGTLEREGLTVRGLDLASPQGDRAVMAALSLLGARIARRGDAVRATADHPHGAAIDVADIPDLVPPLAAVAATAPGTTRLRNAGRLRLKESDRLATVCAALAELGGKACVEEDDLVIEGVEQLRGGTVDAANDHRIAMMAAVLATHAAGPVNIHGAECVAKSYPAFWDDYRALGGSATHDEGRPEEGE